MSGRFRDPSCQLWQCASPVVSLTGMLRSLFASLNRGKGLPWGARHESPGKIRGSTPRSPCSFGMRAALIEIAVVKRGSGVSK